MAGVARTRIGRIRLKSGGELRLLPSTKDVEHAAFNDWARGQVNEILATQGDVAGFALVVWGADGLSTSGCATRDAKIIPAILVPEFAKSRLLAQKIEEWTIATMNGQR